MQAGRFAAPTTAHAPLNSKRPIGFGCSNSRGPFSSQWALVARLCHVRKQFTDLQNACDFADAIVETVREPLLVLDARPARDRRQPRVLSVQGQPDDTEGKLLYELGDGQWDIPKLHALLEKIIPEKA